MIVETKLNLHDRQWLIRGSNIEEVRITQINVIVNERNGTSGGTVVSMSYKVSWCDPDISLYGDKQKHEMFDSKQEAGIAMLKANGLDCGVI